MTQYGDHDTESAERKRKAQAQRDRSLAEKRRKAMCEVMATSAGRVVMRELLEMCRLFHPTFNTNALAMAHAEGVRNVGLMLTTTLTDRCPNHYVTMMTEEQNERIESSDGD
ncbi:MAG: hypothetical protein LBI35_02625 [Burkholderiales bacterium]|jgi:hypothetical protein|nr:hypothetical protein [Burkholderiales bacterium]